MAGKGKRLDHLRNAVEAASGPMGQVAQHLCTDGYTHTYEIVVAGTPPHRGSPGRANYPSSRGAGRKADYRLAAGE